MASVKRCQACRTVNALELAFCKQCGAAAFDMAVGGVGVGRTNPAPMNDAVPRQAGAVLEWPWECRHVDDRLAVGRDESFSPIAQYLDSYDNVSRRHAEIVLEDGRLAVRDLESTNGTFVNDKRIACSVLVGLNDGDQVRFGKNLTARVRIPTR